MPKLSSKNQAIFIAFALHNFIKDCVTFVKIKSALVKGQVQWNEAHIWQNVANLGVFKNYHLVEENKKKQNIVVSRSSRKAQISTIWYFHATTPNSDLNINNNMTNKKTKKN